ncbi:MAG: hypothetical protein IPN74_20390 [Haliscomenobacter sp.]|nr:hypothetical protein [Haliscomenobacter sp.]MBK8880775.1 hypothetical protein [Haliscomenobacter sp.]
MNRLFWNNCFLILLFRFPLGLTAQPLWTGAPVWEYPMEVRALQLDKLGQVYALSQEGELVKFSPEGEVLARFSMQSLGLPAYADVSDPLQALLWYPDFQTMLLLDRTLNPYSQIRLPMEAFPDPVLAALGRENQIWVYDRFLSRLLKLNRQGQVLSESQDLSLNGLAPYSPRHLVAGQEGVFLAAPETGILYFDRLGQFQFTIPIKDIDHLQLYLDSGLIFRKGNQFWLLSGPRQDPTPLEVPEPCQHLCLQFKTVAVYSEGVIRFFRRQP